jgi:hypothetical protein
MQVREKIYMPADIYDYLMLLSEVYGGIGAGKYRSAHSRLSAPYCAYGYASDIEDVMSRSAVSAVFDYNHITIPDNDQWVGAVNKRANKRPHARISFTDWVTEGNVVRKDESTDEVDTVRLIHNCSDYGS